MTDEGQLLLCEEVVRDIEGILGREQYLHSLYYLYACEQPI